MSVLETLKGKLNSVQHDISSSFKSLRTKKKRIRKTSKTEGVDLDAGADLLNRYHESWVSVCRASEENAKQAVLVDTKVTAMYLHIEKQNQAMNQLLTLVSGLPQFLNDIKSSKSKLDMLDADLGEVESKLVHLEDICEQHDLASNKLQHEYQLSLYRQRKNVELEQVKVNLAKEHAEKVQGYEVKLQEILKERQQAFEQEFSQEMANYKKYGHTNLKPKTPSEGEQVDISDITLEQDNSALDEFLQSDEINPTTDQAESNEANGEQETDTDDDTVDKDNNPDVKIIPDQDIDNIDNQVTLADLAEQYNAKQEGTTTGEENENTKTSDS